jgi:uncharacterized protein (TIGR03067 family)
MKTRLLVASVVALLVAADDPGAKKDQEQIRGTWTVSSAERGGKAVDLTQERHVPKQFIFGDGKVEVRTGGDRKRNCTFKLDAGSKPKAITLTSDEDANHVIAASYLLDGDTLKLCVDEANIKESPKEMASKEGTQLVLVVFKREKK